MRRQAMTANICFDFICPLCDKPWGSGHVGVIIITSRAKSERACGQARHTQTSICRYCARAIGKVDVET